MDTFWSILLIVSILMSSVTAMLILLGLAFLFAFTHNWVAFVVVVILFVLGQWSKTLKF